MLSFERPCADVKDWKLLCIPELLASHSAFAWIALTNWVRLVLEAAGADGGLENCGRAWAVAPIKRHAARTYPLGRLSRTAFIIVAGFRHLWGRSGSHRPLLGGPLFTYWDLFVFLLTWVGEVFALRKIATWSEPG